MQPKCFHQRQKYRQQLPVHPRSCQPLPPRQNTNAPNQAGHSQDVRLCTLGVPLEAQGAIEVQTKMAQHYGPHTEANYIQNPSSW
jgi:hypothetical protein